MITTGPVALVTGARKGLGRFLADHLVECGYVVVGCGRSRPADPLPTWRYSTADVTDEGAVHTLIASIKRDYGRLDAVLNNAGVASMNHVLLTPSATLTKLLRTNVLGTFLVSREAARLMRPGGGGRIVNFSTIAVPLRLEGQSAYVASKRAVEGLSQVMARELSEFGITVNVVGPTPVDTDMIRGVPKEKIQKLLDSLPVNRLGTREDVANVVDFFLDPRSQAVTGQVVYLGGATG